MIKIEEQDVPGARKRNTFPTEAGDIIYQSAILNESIVKEYPNESSLNHIADKKQSILTMKDEWSTYSSIGVQRKILKENTNIIKDFMNSLAVPSWYRGVSLFQRKSADLLLNAIRDDCAQRTVYRTMRCLDSIGLDPLPTKKQLRTILPLCGGSDLALLWFLMEWLYRDNESDSYSVNEQLIMSSIAHLDMNTTLRELDRILPPGQAPKPSMVQKSSKNCSKIPNKTMHHNNGSVLPYFEKLQQPKSRKKSYFSTKLNRRAILDCYQHQFIDSSHVMVNESNRWFQGYNINDNINNNFEAAMFDENKVQTMYRQHEDIDYLRNSFEAQLDAIAKRNVQEMRKIFEKKHQSYKRIINRLQHDIGKFRREFHTMAEKCREHCSLKLLTNKVQGKQVNNNDIKLNTNQCDGHKEQQSVASTCTIGVGNRKTLAQKFSSIESSDKYDFDSKSSENDSMSKYFVTSLEHQPFKFDYCKIFAYNHSHLELLKIRESSTEAEDSDITLLNPFQKHSPVELYCSEAVENEGNNCIEFTSNGKDSVQQSVVDFALDYYDPDDDELMDRMLKDALEIMKNDHKFVFASIPAAHRFPMLREWIRLRYGKIYKKEELKRSFQKSLPIFAALAKIGLPVELPSNADMGSDLIMDYSCRDYVLRKSNYIRNEYYRRIDKAMLAQTRAIYLAMRPSLCCSGSPRNTIFAYMPAHKRKNYHFRPWKPEECMKRKQVSYFHTWKSHSLPANKLKSINNRLKSSRNLQNM
ncbi:uncharacterized protein LOC135962117 [Calliphora vicina]|uniref:uncharacterized protein LOC135962117 n=1 Tax=Calliphora vicina TaxID=7373 RepID=UPI00325B5903